VQKELGITEKRTNLFEKMIPLNPSAWLQETLEVSLELALSSSSEKARSEFIVVPILLEMEKKNPKVFSIYSGERLDVDGTRGLNGECDFILSRGPISTLIQAPIFSIVEAKKNDIKSGLGQCIAQLVGAKMFNEKAENDIKSIYGCVTTGEDWQFMKLLNNIVYMDVQRYYINEINKLLGVMQTIIDTCFHLS
jgi:hypothetical protein